MPKKKVCTTCGHGHTGKIPLKKLSTVQLAKIALEQLRRKKRS